MKRTEDEVVALGDYCKEVLGSDQFNTLFDEFKQDHFDLMLGTEPHEVKKREGIFAEMNGFRSFQAMMHGYVVRRAQIIQSRETREQSIADDSDDE
jgi:hypothetical protein